MNGTPPMSDATAPQFDVRCATLADAAEIARLSGELGYPASAIEMRARLSVLLPQDGQFVAVAADERGLLGWISAERRTVLASGPSVEIVGLVVDARARRAGVGHALVASAEQWARSQDVGRFTVRSSAARDASHPFYERLGFVRRKTQHCYEKALTLGA